MSIFDNEISRNAIGKLIQELSEFTTSLTMPIFQQIIFSILLDKSSFIYNYLDYELTHKHFPEFKNGFQGEREKELWRLIVLAHYFENHKEYIL